MNIKRLIRSLLRRYKYDIVRFNPDYDPLGDLAADEKKLILSLGAYTMTSVERIASLVDSMNYISRNNIPGDIVECGVWRGGSMMAIAATLLANNDTGRSLYLYDTYEGMSAPTAYDKTSTGCEDAAELLSREAHSPERDWEAGFLCYASIEDVKKNVLSTGYPSEKVHFIKGKVEETIPSVLPKDIALLRLDTDWYESTKHELEHLYPLLSSHGIMIIDDYGVWQGARKAVDEYFEREKSPVFLHRIDYTGRLVAKAPSSQ